MSLIHNYRSAVPLGKRHELSIGKDGSRLLRWAVVEAAWRLVRLTHRWHAVFERLAGRRGRRKAIVAVARRLLTVLVAIWRGGLRYRPAAMLKCPPGQLAPQAARRETRRVSRVLRRDL